MNFIILAVTYMYMVRSPVKCMFLFLIYTLALFFKNKITFFFFLQGFIIILFFSCWCCCCFFRPPLLVYDDEGIYVSSTELAFATPPTCRFSSHLKEFLRDEIKSPKTKFLVHHFQAFSSSQLFSSLVQFFPFKPISLSSYTLIYRFFSSLLPYLFISFFPKVYTHIQRTENDISFKSII